MTLVSIGVPVHNGAAHLDAALSALRLQDHRDLEIVVCENASEDDSLAIALRHAAEDGRVRVEPTTALLGAVDNFNRCLSLTTGELFMWAAHDDLFASTYVSTCIAALEASSAAACVTDALIVDANDVVTARRPVDPRYASSSLRDRLRAHAQAQDWLEVYAVYRRSALPATPMRAVPGPDVLLTWALLQVGPLVVVPEPLFRYRRVDRDYKTALESFAGMLGGGGPRALRGLNAQLWRELWRSSPTGIAHVELLRSLATRNWVRRFRDDLQAEAVLRRGGP